MPGLGEARKFMSPEDREALVSSSQEVRESQDDPEKLAEAEGNRSSLRERISEKMWQEIYRRGSAFGQELLFKYQRLGDLPWSDVCEMLSAKSVSPELEQKYPEAAEHIKGMSSTQKIIFTKIVMYAEQDHLDAEAVMKQIESQVRQESLTGTPEEIGRALFMACNTKGKAKLAPPVGIVVYHRRGPFIELEMSDDRDIDALYDGEYSGSRNGFFSTNENFYVRGGKLPKYIGNSRLVVFKKNSRGTLEHEEGHYLHRLSERARSFVDGTELKRQSVVEKRLKDLEKLYRWPWNIGKRDEIVRLYKDALSDLQAICFDRAKSEIAASYYAGDYQCGNNLYVASEHGTESSYNVYGAVFGKRLGKIAAPLRALVNAKREEYNGAVLEQSAALSLLATSLRMMGLEPQYRDKINALVADYPITGISEGIKKTFGAEFLVARKYNDLQFGIDMSYRRVKNIGEDYPSERVMVRRADDLVARFINIIEERVAKPVRSGSDLPAAFAAVQPELEEIKREMKQLQARVWKIRLKLGNESNEKETHTG